DNYTSASAGSINVDGRTLSYTGLSQTRGIFDPLAAATRTFNFPATNDTVTLGDDPASQVGISPVAGSSNPPTAFVTPTGSSTANLGRAADTRTASRLDAVNPTRVVNHNGLDGTDVAADGGDTFNVTPSAATPSNIDGDNPPPPASPGDTLNVNLAGTTNPFLNSTSTPSGATGGYTLRHPPRGNLPGVQTPPPAPRPPPPNTA